MVADVLEAGGWDVRFLGTNTPISSVVAAVEEHEASILGISATMLFNLYKVIQLADAVRAKTAGRVRIVVGGAAFREAPSLYRDLGAVGCGLDLKSAVALLDQLA
jgi:methanogenic corrinoid protein MtbC1